MRLGIEDVLERQPFRRIHARIVVGRGASRLGGGERPVGGARSLSAQPAPRRQPLVVAQRVVERQADAHLQRRSEAAAEERDQELERLDQVRRDAEQRLSLAEVETNEAEVQHLEIAQPAMDDPRRRRSRPAAEVLLLDQRHAQAAQCRVAGDPAPDNAAADDRHIEALTT